MNERTRILREPESKPYTPTPPFPNVEYERRWQSLRAAMGVNGLDVIVVTSQQNYEYLSGHRSMSWLIKSRPLAFVLPIDGEAVVLAAQAMTSDVEALGLVPRVVAYEGFETAAASALAVLLTELGFEESRVGFELGLEQRLGLPVADFDLMRRRLAKASFIDASSALWSVRMLKSDDEIDRLRRAGDISGRALAKLLEEAGSGWTERDLYRRFATDVVDAGAERPGYVTISQGPGTYHRHNGWPGQRQLVRGELLWMDAGCVYEGYWSDYTRCAAVGTATQSQKKTYRVVAEVLEKMLAEIRPRLPAARLMETAAKACSEAGFSIRVASRVGHGLGLDLTEPPSLNLACTTTLDVGMALAVEPALLTDEGWFHLEENIVVTSGGFTRLSWPMPEQLPILDA